MASSVETTKALCVVCNKAKGIYTCAGCSQMFCLKHSNDHRNELNKQLEEVAVTHDLLQHTLNQQTDNPQLHPLIKRINQWEKMSILKIHQVAEKAKNEILNGTTQHANQVKQKLQILSNELKEGREESDFSEIDLRQWTLKLEELKNELVSPTTITIEEDSTLLVTSIRIAREDTTDIFERVCGIAEIKDNGRRIVQNNQVGHTHIRGKREYNTGFHTLRFQLEQLRGWIFFGIINKSEPMSVASYESPSSYGWSNSNQIYSGGPAVNGTTMVIIQNDIIELLINCDQRKIQLKNIRLNKTIELSVDINKCPFPWQLHFNLHGANTLVRKLDPFS